MSTEPQTPLEQTIPPVSSPASPKPVHVASKLPTTAPRTPTPVSNAGGTDDHPILLDQTPTNALRNSNAAAFGTETPPRPEEDSTVSSLVAIFPTLDKGTIKDVLRSQGGNAEAAVPYLLELCGGEKVDSEATEDTHLASDEALARQLASQQDNPSQQYSNLNYQPRISNRTQHSQGQYQEETGEPRRDELDNVIEGFKSAAVTARSMGEQAAAQAKTIGTNIFTRVQSKIKEIQDQNAEKEAQQQEIYSQNEKYSMYGQNQQPAPQQKSSGFSFGKPASSSQSSSSFSFGNSFNNLASKAQQTLASVSGGASGSTSSANVATPAASNNPTTPRITSSLSHQSRYARPSSTATAASTSPPTQTGNDLLSTSPNSPPGIKSGLTDSLQRKRISLSEPSRQPGASGKSTMDPDDSDDDIEYSRNPFDEADR